MFPGAHIQLQSKAIRKRLAFHCCTKASYTPASCVCIIPYRICLQCIMLRLDQADLKQKQCCNNSHICVHACYIKYHYNISCFNDLLMNCYNKVLPSYTQETY